MNLHEFWSRIKRSTRNTCTHAHIRTNLSSIKTPMFLKIRVSQNELLGRVYLRYTSLFSLSGLAGRSAASHSRKRKKSCTAFLLSHHNPDRQRLALGDRYQHSTQPPDRHCDRSHILPLVASWATRDVRGAVQSSPRLSNAVLHLRPDRLVIPAPEVSSPVL